MNKRLKKKKEKIIRKEIHNLLDVVLDINGIDKKEQSIAGNRPTLFFEFHGHICEIDIHTNDNGWFPNATFDVFDHVKLTSEHLSAEAKKLKDRYGDYKNVMVTDWWWDERGYRVSSKDWMKRERQAYEEAEREDKENGTNNSIYL